MFFAFFQRIAHTHTSCTAFPLEPPNSIQLDFLLALLSLPWSSWPSFRKTPKKLYFSHFSGKLLANYGFRIFPPTKNTKNNSCRALPLENKQKRCNIDESSASPPEGCNYLAESSVSHPKGRNHFAESSVLPSEGCKHLHAHTHISCRAFALSHHRLHLLQSSSRTHIPLAKHWPY